MPARRAECCVFAHGFARHRYFGLLAANSPPKAAVTALAQAAPT